MKSQLAVLTLVLAQAPTAHTATPSPCALLTNAQVAKALGSKVLSKQEQHYQNSLGRTCLWTGVNLAPPTTYPRHSTLTLTISKATKAQFLTFANKIPGAVRVNEVGVTAFRQGNGNLTDLEVWQSGYALSLIAGEVTDGLTAEKIAARAATKQL